MNLTPRFQRCIDVVITISVIYCEVNFLCNVEPTLAEHSKLDVVVSTLGRHCEIDVAISTLQQRFLCNILVYCELNLLFKVEATLKQRCYFDVVASTSFQRYVLVVQSYDIVAAFLPHCEIAELSQNSSFSVMRRWGSFSTLNFCQHCFLWSTTFFGNKFWRVWSRTYFFLRSSCFW